MSAEARGAGVAEPLTRRRACIKCDRVRPTKQDWFFYEVPLTMRGDDGSEQRASVGVGAAGTGIPAAKRDLAEVIARLAKIGRCGAPSFSPDGTRVAFISDLSGSPQAWSVSIDGGWPEKITAVESGLGPHVREHRCRRLRPQCGAST